MKRNELNSILKTVPIYIKILNRTFIINPAFFQSENILSFDKFVDMIKAENPYIKVIDFLFFCADFSVDLNKQYGTCVGIVEIDEKKLFEKDTIIDFENYSSLFTTPFYQKVKK